MLPPLYLKFIIFQLCNYSNNISDFVIAVVLFKFYVIEAFGLGIYQDFTSFSNLINYFRFTFLNFQFFFYLIHKLFAFFYVEIFTPCLEWGMFCSAHQSLHYWIFYQFSVSIIDKYFFFPFIKVGVSLISTVICNQFCNGFMRKWLKLFFETCNFKLKIIIGVL